MEGGGGGGETNDVIVATHTLAQLSVEGTHAEASHAEASVLVTAGQISAPHTR